MKQNIVPLLELKDRNNYSWLRIDSVFESIYSMVMTKIHKYQAEAWVDY